jgi:hypothetical protein
MTDHFSLFVLTVSVGFSILVSCTLIRNRLDAYLRERKIRRELAGHQSDLAAKPPKLIAFCLDMLDTFWAVCHRLI